MNARERKLLEQLKASIEFPSVTSSTYTVTDGKMTRTEHMPIDEASRRLKSEDYKLGWAACRERTEEYIKELLSPTRPQRNRGKR